MSTASDQRKKASAISLDDDDHSTSPAPTTPRTAPGQLMGLQATVMSQQAEIAKLRDIVRRFEESTSAANPSGAGSSEVDITLIDEVEGRRRKVSTEEYRELVENLRVNPLGQPVVLRRKPDSRYEMIAGHKRWDAYRDLGRTTIPARIVDVDADQASKLAFYTNLLAPNMSDYEKYWNFRQLLGGGTALTHEQLAESAGLSRQHVSRILRFDALPDEVKDMLVNKPDRLGSDAAQSLAQIAASGRTQQVIEAVRKLIDDEAMTQEKAVKLARGETAAPKTQPETLVVKTGKKNFCEITTRSGVVGVRFSKAEAPASAEWARKIHDFIQAELRKEQQKVGG
ncbi:ParB/RepB/Spo0J family partition protein [Burkholderia vietnamiensis]|uniref:ParB/RepB/Spo0J family partition protein n=1 Tax=Burkholderia vietnamiensis TaxID=60552 RepID=UPI001594AB3B|nr:ParB/RepB/Spo0J family partition protein [Burkholderia vietnamiensis]